MPKEPDIPLRISNVAPFVSPYLQRLKISTLSQSKGRCGGRRVKWHFTLDRKAPQDGFFVQKIDAADIAHNDAGNVVRENNAYYWEAWKVKAGYRRAEITSNMRYTDMSERRNIRRSQGADTSFGTVIFYLEKDTGPLDLNWRKGGYPGSGDLHSTINRPAFWMDPPEEGPEYRLATSKWDCVNPNRKNRFSDLSVMP